MSQSAQNQHVARPKLIVYTPPESEANIAHWRINGFPATVTVWTAEEWERLAERPADAQHYPCGVWCALRLE